MTRLVRATATTTPVGGSASTQNFVWNTATQVPQLLMDSGDAYIYGIGGAPAEQVSLSTGQVSYLVTDLLGSVRGIVSSSGNLTASTTYDAWGNPETAGGLTSYSPFGFAGGYADPTGLIYLINRYYDPATGQFVSVDPDASQTLQPYRYADGNPIMDIDPAGLYAILYKPRCGRDGCINITKRCGSDNKCMLFWAMDFFSSRARTAYWVEVERGVWVGGIPVIGLGDYGHAESGAYRWHGEWGIIKAQDWGYYHNLAGRTQYMGPYTRVQIEAYGPMLLRGNIRGSFSGSGSWTKGTVVPWSTRYEWPYLP